MNRSVFLVFLLSATASANESASFRVHEAETGEDVPERKLFGGGSFSTPFGKGGSFDFGKGYPTPSFGKGYSTPSLGKGFGKGYDYGKGLTHAPVAPTKSPTPYPTTIAPTWPPTISPTNYPTLSPTTSSPTTTAPTWSPTVSPTNYPTKAITKTPTYTPTVSSPPFAPVKLWDQYGHDFGNGYGKGGFNSGTGFTYNGKGFSFGQGNRKLETADDILEEDE